MLYCQFHFDNESQWNKSIAIKHAYLLNGSEHIYWILDLEGEVHSIWDLGKMAFKKARTMIFLKSDRQATIFGRVQKIWFFKTGNYLCPNLPPPKSSWGRFNVPRLASCMENLVAVQCAIDLKALQSNLDNVTLVNRTP